MHKGILWAGIGLIVAAGGAYVALSMVKGKSATQTASSTPQSSLRELAASDSPKMCTFRGADGSQGTVYADSGRVRGDFNAAIAGKSITGHFIVRDNTSYVWMDGMAQGFKNSFEATSTAQGGLSADERMPYSCGGWSADENVFTLPEGVEFEAIGAAEVKAGAAAAGASCSQCERAPDAASKEQCLAALHCQQ